MVFFFRYFLTSSVNMRMHLKYSAFKTTDQDVRGSVDRAHVTNLTESNVGLRSAVNMMDYYLWNFSQRLGLFMCGAGAAFHKRDWLHSCECNDPGSMCYFFCKHGVGGHSPEKVSWVCPSVKTLFSCLSHRSLDPKLQHEHD